MVKIEIPEDAKPRARDGKHEKGAPKRIIMRKGGVSTEVPAEQHDEMKAQGYSFGQWVF